MCKKIVFCMALVAFMMSHLCACSDSAKIENNVSQLQIAYGAQDTSNMSNVERAARVKKHLVQIEGIEGANVVITGRTALIGIKITSSDPEEITRLKNEAAQRTRFLDPRVTNTAITSNEEIMAMIAQLEKEKEESE